MKRPHTAGDYFNLLIAVAVMGVMLVLGVVLLVNGISHKQAAEIIGGAFLAAIGGIVPAFLIYLLFQRMARSAAPGHAPPKIALVLTGTQTAPGRALTGRVDVIESGKVRKLEVLLRCHDRTADYKGVSWASEPTVLATGELTAPNSFSFSLALPADAPPTFSSGSAGIWWEIDARCDVLGTDMHAAQRIEVAAPARVA